MFAMPVFGEIDKITPQELYDLVKNAEGRMTEIQFKKFVNDLERLKARVHWWGIITEVKEVPLIGSFTDERRVEMRGGWGHPDICFNVDKSIAIQLNKGRRIEFFGTVSSIVQFPLLGMPFTIVLSDVDILNVVDAPD